MKIGYEVQQLDMNTTVKCYRSGIQATQMKIEISRQIKRLTSSQRIEFKKNQNLEDKL